MGLPDYHHNYFHPGLTTNFLGNFNIHIQGEICPCGNKSWRFTGDLIITDTYDFNRRTEGRSGDGEWKTTFGRSFMHGTNYEVRSVPINVDHIWGARPKLSVK